mmetsp:Transcript_32777/g.98660  ORF Transcript_32777/g.98660 Transcript_32777/m.98660 type:complete len:130 (-) Transcript_32777:24-413(-)
MAALSAAERGDAAAELAWLERSLKASPTHAKALVNRAVLHGEAGDLAAELACNRAAADANPNSAVALNALASCLGMRGDCDAALELFGRVAAAKGWGDAEEFGRAEQLTGVVERMKKRMVEQRRQQGGA